MAFLALPESASLTREKSWSSFEEQLTRNEQVGGSNLACGGASASEVYSRGFESLQECASLRLRWCRRSGWRYGELCRPRPLYAA